MVSYCHYCSGCVKKCISMAAATARRNCVHILPARGLILVYSFNTFKKNTERYTAFTNRLPAWQVAIIHFKMKKKIAQFLQRYRRYRYLNGKLALSKGKNIVIYTKNHPIYTSIFEDVSFDRYQFVYLDF